MPKRNSTAPLFPVSLTKRQADVYKFVFDHVLENGFQPGAADVSRQFQITMSAVYQVFGALEKKGWVLFKRRKSGRAARFLFCPDGQRFSGFEVKHEQQRSEGSAILIREARRKSGTDAGGAAAGVD
jgi:hypothetical protein